jgi:PPM family protein phosphatase
MAPTAVAVALIAALMGVIAGLAYWRARRRKAARRKAYDRAWDRHARVRPNAPPSELSRGDAAPLRLSSDEAAPGSEARGGKSGGSAKAGRTPMPGAASRSNNGPKSTRGSKSTHGPKSSHGPKSTRSPKSIRAPKPPRSPKPPADPAPAPAPAAPSTASEPKAPAASSAEGDPIAVRPAAASRPSQEPAQFPWRDDYPGMLDESEDDTDLTIVTLGPLPNVPRLVELREDTLYDDDEDDDPNGLRDQRSSAVPIVYDDDAAIDEPTAAEALILVSAAGQTDRGQRRRKNEDSYAILTDHGVFVVADGMGGHSGGEIASKIAVDVITEAFLANQFNGELSPDVPRRGSELAMAIQMANLAIYQHARGDNHLTGMGTTVVSARFSPNKQRAYIGHVGDSRCYRLRDEELRQITTDHTMGAVGLTGPLADRLERAVGIAPGVKVDVILARPIPEDLYLLCSDGLSKMVGAAEIREILINEKKLDQAAAKLIERANASGGKDNITVILVKITSPVELSKVLSA